MNEIHREIARQTSAVFHPLLIDVGFDKKGVAIFRIFSVFSCFLGELGGRCWSFSQSTLAVLGGHEPLASAL
jgi:hypothetical protein